MDEKEFNELSDREKFLLAKIGNAYLGVNNADSVDVPYYKRELREAEDELDSFYEERSEEKEINE